MSQDDLKGRLQNRIMKDAQKYEKMNCSPKQNNKKKLNFEIINL